MASPLWSMQWEVFFSLLLTAFILFGRVRPSLGWLNLGVLAVAMLVGVRDGHASLIYLPMFALGVLIAHHREELGALTGRHSRGGWWISLIVALLLVDSAWYVRALNLTGEAGRDAIALVTVLSALACAWCLFIEMLWQSAARQLERPAPAWL